MTITYFFLVIQYRWLAIPNYTFYHRFILISHLDHLKGCPSSVARTDERIILAPVDHRPGTQYLIARIRLDVKDLILVLNRYQRTVVIRSVDHLWSAKLWIVGTYVRTTAIQCHRCSRTYAVRPDQVRILRIVTMAVIHNKRITVYHPDRLDRRYIQIIGSYRGDHTLNLSLTTFPKVIHRNRHIRRAAWIDHISVKAPHQLILRIRMGCIKIYMVIITCLVRRWLWHRVCRNIPGIPGVHIALAILRTDNILCHHLPPVRQIRHHLAKRSIVRIAQLRHIKPEAATHHDIRWRNHCRHWLVLYFNLYHAIRKSSVQHAGRRRHPVRCHRARARIHIKHT